MSVVSRTNNLAEHTSDIVLLYHHRNHCHLNLYVQSNRSYDV